MAVEGVPGCSPAVAGEAGGGQWFSQTGVLGPGQARVWALRALTKLPPSPSVPEKGEPEPHSIILL